MEVPAEDSTFIRVAIAILFVGVLLLFAIAATTSNDAPDADDAAIISSGLAHSA